LPVNRHFCTYEKRQRKTRIKQLQSTKINFSRYNYLHKDIKLCASYVVSVLQ
jgi:hypothetical protein